MRYAIMSQSLSSRAMSFDLNRGVVTKMSFNRLNPFRAGRCLSTRKSVTKRKRTRIVSIPFEQGDVFRQDREVQVFENQCLNPFRAGRCLSTAAVCWRQESCGLSDPLPNFFGRLRSWLLI